MKRCGIVIVLLRLIPLPHQQMRGGIGGIGCQNAVEVVLNVVFAQIVSNRGYLVPGIQVVIVVAQRLLKIVDGAVQTLRTLLVHHPDPVVRLCELAIQRDCPPE